MPYPVNIDEFNFDSKEMTLSAYRLLEDARSYHKKRKSYVVKELPREQNVKIPSEKMPYNQIIKQLLRKNKIHDVSKRKYTNTKSMNKMNTT